MKLSLLISLSFALVLLSPKFVWGRIETLQSLNFGTIAVTKNDFASSISIDPAGNVQVVGGIAVLVDGNEAIYEISEFPVNTTLNVVVHVLNSQMSSGISSEETFVFSTIVNSGTLLTDDDGIAILNVGGKIQTTGSGSIQFSSTLFTSNIQIDVNL